MALLQPLTSLAAWTSALSVHLRPQGSERSVVVQPLATTPVSCPCLRDERCGQLAHMIHKRWCVTSPMTGTYHGTETDRRTPAPGRPMIERRARGGEVRL
eukprot:CAMPEP_0185213748 /NCGR_PEP_ID=MMETSP1140-20130426/68189_1 /TAXON_ID=298111 /ORGANISM="Pavlova sp., Strain CCMP459" /LENGTH=99 /DNA_ID=CAMNT_0027781607 /DNA_START=434 /DNA_END=729 /DNA_ORIENTATION=+